MLQISGPAYLVHAEEGEESEGHNIEQKQEEWLHGQVTHTVVCPGTVVVHHENATFTFAAVMSSFDFDASTFQALLLLLLDFSFFRITLISLMKSIYLRFFWVFVCEHLGSSEVFPFHETRVLSFLRNCVAPLSHNDAKCGREQ